MADPTFRHSAYIPTSRSEGFSKYLLTLIAQRRELREECMKHALSQGSMHADSLQKSMLFTNMSIQGVESERKELQQELALSLETCHPLSSAECLRHLQLTAGAPLSDAPDSQAVLLYFKARLAALHCEQRSMQAHLLKLRRCHLQHVKSLVLRPELSEPALPRSQLDHVGPVSQGGCKCNQEIEVTMQGIQALQLAQADAAARNARLLQPSRKVEEGDWWIVLTHVVSMASGDRLAQRFRDRVEALPWSHHHRFLIYEQVSGMPIQRDREMLKAGLRVPPYYARTSAEAEAVLRELIEDFKCEEGADALLATQPTVHASEAASTKRGAAFGSEGSATTSDGLPSVHGILYAARKLLHKVLERHRLLTPGTPSASEYDDQGVAPVTTSSMPGANLPLITPGKQRGSSVKQSDSHIMVVDRYSDRLEALIPSIQGDLSAAHAAILNGLGAAASAPLGSGVGLGSTGGSMHIDEVLRAETVFLEECDLFQVSQRLKTLAEERKERFSYLARVNTGLRDQAREDVEEGAALSLAKTVDRSAWALSEKALEAVVTLRFLRMQRNRLKVMHYLNAMVSLQLVLLTDETTEEAAGSSTRYATTALKDMTCPIRYASRHAQNHVTAPSPGEIEGMRYGGESQSSEGFGGTSEEADVLIMDEWLEDRDSGVTVRDPSGRRFMYKHALSLMSRVEEEILRVATHHAERYAAQLYAAGRGSEVAELDQTAMLDDLWAFEAGYCEARHKCLLAYFSAYRHSESWGVMEDLFAGLGSAQEGCSGPVAAASMSCCSTGTPVHPTPDMNHSASSTNKWEGLAANTPLPQVLAARVQLRREIVDLTFRRPSICPEAGYFATSYIESTVSIELEAELVGRLTAAVAQQQRAAMATAFTSAQAAAAAAAAASKPVAVGQAWSLGLPASVLYGELYGSGSERSLMQEGAVLPAVGAAAAALPALIRKVVGTLADVHQLKHASDMSELRQRVLQYSLVELQVLLQEEQHRAHAVPDRVPKDSLFRETMGKGVGDAAVLGQFNWLCRSHVADNPVVVMSEARQLGVTPKKVVEMILNKEKVIRQLYSSEVLWLVYCCQSRALGKKVTMPELQGIDWDNIDAEGKLLKPEVLKTSLSPCEPVEEEPPGSSGPPGEELASGGGSGGGGQGIMFGVGSAGVLGGIWRAPPLALAEFSTQMAELLQPHSLAGLRAMLEGKSGLGSVGKRGAVKQNGRASATPRVIPISDDGPDAMANAARAQILRVLSLELSIKHNQILLDFIVRKLDRRRRVLMWRAAAMEGVTGRPGQGDTDLVVGAPPGHYAPAVPPGVHKPPGHEPEKYEQQIVEDPPLLRDPPKPKVLKTRYHRGTANSSKDDTGSQSEGAVSGPGGRNEGLGALSSKALNDLKACRRRLCNDASPLWLDIISLKLKLRENVCMEFVNSARESAAIDTLPIKLELFHRYIEAFLTALTPAAVKHDLAECCRVLAVLMIGSTGGVGYNWGLKISKDGHQLISKPEPGPFFDGLEGADRLHCLVLEYGPMWQAVNFETADKPGDSDPMHWAPGIAAIPSGFMLPDLNGNARLDLMWQVPSQWDVLSVTCFEETAMGESSPEGPSMLPETVQLDGLSLLEGGLKLGQLLIFMLRAVLFEAALLAPALDLARGSDLTRHNTHQAAIYSSIHDSHSHSISTESSARQSLHPPPLTGLAMYRAVEARVIASLQPFLPGALMAPALITLHGRMQYLVEVGKGKGPKEAPSFSRSIPLPSAIKFLQKEVSLHALTHITAIARARDALAGVPAKEPAWRLTGALEYAAARAAASPELRLNIMEGAALRLQNAERVAIHNEINRLHLLTERVVAECCPSFSTHPLKAQEITEYLLHGVWSHDRIRDALAWRSMLMDQPELYPFRPAHEGHYLRRFHRPLPLHLNLLPPTASAKAFFELHYQNAVLQRAEAYVREAESAYNARSSGHEEEESVLKVKTSGSAMSEGKPGWLSSSPAWPSPEARLIEAALVIMKKALDMQGIQIALLRLSEDCDKLAGLSSSLSATSSTPTSNGLHTFITQCTPFSCLLSPTADSPQGGHAAHALRELSSLLAPENQSDAVQTVVSSAVSPAVQSLVRKLFNVRRRGNGNSASLSTDDAVFEFSSDELSRWMMEATAQITVDARSALRSMGSAMVRERKAVHDFCGTLQATVADLGTDVESFMRRQAIKIETQVVDRAMLLLSELHEIRRTCSRYQEDSRRSLELSYIEAQKQWGDKMDEVKNALLVSQTNGIAMKADMYKSALEALLEVRREALNKAFGVDGVQGEAGVEIMRMMQVESQLEAVQAEVLDMQRAMVKVQTWFKMRSNAFQTACMREVLRARDKVQGMEAAMWEERERSELAIEQLSSQLAATQADLEVANASLAKSTADLVHARASNKKLMAWRVSELPRTEALRMQLAEARSSREAASKAGYVVASERFRMLERHQKLTLTLVTSKVGNSGGSSPRQSRRTDSPSGSKKAAAPGRDEELPVHNARRDGLGSNQDLDQQSSGMLLLEHCEQPIEKGLNDGDESQRMLTASKIMAMQQAWDVQRGELRSQVEELRKELQEERSAKNELFERFMTGTAGTARGSAAAATAGWQSDQGLEGLPQASAERLDPQALLSTPEIHGMANRSRSRSMGWPTEIHGNANSRSEGGTALAMQLDILGRRHAQLCRDTEVVVEERDALRRVLVAVRMAAPELAAALGISSTVDSTGSPAVGGPNMMPPSLNQKFQAPKQLQHHSGQPVIPTASLSQTRVPDHAQTSPTSEEADGVNSRLPSSTMQGHGGSTGKVPLRATNMVLTPGTVNASQLALQTPATMRLASDTYAPAGGLSVPLLSTAEAPTTRHNVRPTSARRPLSNDLKATDGGNVAASVAASSRTSADNADTSGTAAKRKSQLEVVGSSTQSTPMLSPRKML